MLTGSLGIELKMFSSVSRATFKSHSLFVALKQSTKTSLTYHPTGISKISNLHLELLCILWLEGINKKISSSRFSYRQQASSIRLFNVSKTLR